MGLRRVIGGTTAGCRRLGGSIFSEIAVDMEVDVVARALEEGRNSEFEKEAVKRLVSSTPHASVVARCRLRASRDLSRLKSARESVSASFKILS